MASVGGVVSGGGVAYLYFSPCKEVWPVKEVLLLCLSFVGSEGFCRRCGF